MDVSNSKVESGHTMRLSKAQLEEAISGRPRIAIQTSITRQPQERKYEHLGKVVLRGCKGARAATVHILKAETDKRRDLPCVGAALIKGSTPALARSEQWRKEAGDRRADAPERAPVGETYLIDLA